MPIINMFKNICIPVVCSIAMGIVGFLIKGLYSSLMWQIVCIIICIIIYFATLMTFKSSRNDILRFINKTNIISKIKFNKKLNSKLSNNI